MGGQTLWYVSRATGSATLVLLTLVVVLGVVTAGRRRPEGESATIVMALHRWLSLGLVAFLGIHVITAILDGYVSIAISAVVVPFTSTYERLWVGLGTVALDLLLAVVVTSLLRHRMAERAWRWVHWAAYALWPSAVVHAFMLGTANQPLLRWTTVACGLVALGAAGWRLAGEHSDAGRRRQVAGTGTWR